ATAKPATAAKSSAAGKAATGKASAGKAVGGAGPPGIRRRRARRPSPPAVRLARHRADDHGEHHGEHDERQDQDQDRAPRQPRIGSLRRALLPFFGVAREHADDVVGTAGDAPRDIVGAKARDDCVLDDELGDGVSERALEAVADLDAYLALAWGHDQQHAVVLVALSDPPAAAELNAEIFDRGALQRLERDDHELVGGL